MKVQVRQSSRSTLLMGQAPRNRGVQARPAMDERPGMIIAAQSNA